MLIQIYEIRTPTEARLVSEAGVDHVGVLVGTGEFPREIPIEEAHSILRAIPKKSRRVVLTLSSQLLFIEEIASQLRPDILHLGALPEAISPDHVRSLKQKFTFLKMMRSIPVIDEHSVTLAQQYDQIADFLLLDSHKTGDVQVGATGFTHDWGISRRIVERVKTPVILAGGLGPENVAEAIRDVQPAGVDSKTKTDKNGSHEKDLEKVKNFVAAALERRL